MTGDDKARTANRRANAGSGAAGIGLGTLLVIVAPELNLQESVIELIQYASPTISVAGAFLFKWLYSGCEKQLELRRIDLAKKRLREMEQNDEINPKNRKALRNKMEELEWRQIMIIADGNLNEIEEVEGLSNSLKTLA